MKALMFWALVILNFATGCMRPATDEPARLSDHHGPVRISGAYALYPLASIWVKEYQKVNPAVNFELLARGSGSVWQDLLERRIDLAMVSSETLPDFDSLLWMTPVARLGVVLITSSSNPCIGQIRQRGLTRGELAMAFTGQPDQLWGGLAGKQDADVAHPYVRTDSAGSTEQLAKFLWQNASDLKGEGVHGDEAMLAAVMKDPLSLGYCNFVYAFDPHSQRFREGITIIPLNPERKGRGIDAYYDSVPSLQRAMWSGKYPSGLIRNLYFVSYGRPATVALVDFLRWVLTDGQRLVAREGYIEVHSSEIRCRLESLSR